MKRKHETRTKDERGHFDSLVEKRVVKEKTESG